MGVQPIPGDNNAFNIEEPITLPTRKLQLDELPFLTTIGQIDSRGIITIHRSLKGTQLKTPVSFPVDKILSLGERGLAEYILTSLIKTRPLLLPWTLENQTLIALASHLLRAGSGSPDSCFAYLNDVSLHIRWLKLAGESADRLISDVKRDPCRLENHKTFLAKHLAEMQDRDLAPGRLKGFARHVRTFYRVNDIELPKPKTMPRQTIINKDRSPTPEELQKLLSIGDLRENTIVSMLALGGFREATLAMLQYRHVREDLEANKIPLHIHVDVEIVKGHYADYDTFLGQEAVDYLRLSLEQRRKGTPPQYRNGKPIKYIAPEEIRDESPLIRDTRLPRPVGAKNIFRIVHRLYSKAGLSDKNSKGHYDLRVHSIRKYFKTQLIARKVAESHADYWMGHVGDEYNLVQNLGVEKLREIYSNAVQEGFSIRPRAYINKLEMAKEVVRELLRKMDVDPEDLVKAFAARPHRTLANKEARDEYDLELYLAALGKTVRLKANASPEPSSLLNLA